MGTNNTSAKAASKSNASNASTVSKERLFALLEQTMKDGSQFIAPIRSDVEVTLLSYVEKPASPEAVAKGAPTVSLYGLVRVHSIGGHTIEKELFMNIVPSNNAWTTKLHESLTKENTVKAVFSKVEGSSGWGRLMDPSHKQAKAKPSLAEMKKSMASAKEAHKRATWKVTQSDTSESI